MRRTARKRNAYLLLATTKNWCVFFHEHHPLPKMYIFLCMPTYWVYMLRCCDDSFYIGVTNNLEMRLEEHYTGFHEGSYTQKRLPVELVYNVFFTDVLDAIAFEKRIKRWTRAKKEALIAGNKDLLRYGARGQCRRRVDDMRTGFSGRFHAVLQRPPFVSLRRTQADKTVFLPKSSCHGESVEP